MVSESTDCCNLKNGNSNLNLVSSTFSQNLPPLRSPLWRKRHNRRRAKDVPRQYPCPYEGCEREFGSESSVSLHMKLKHNGGTKSQRNLLAHQILTTYQRVAKALPTGASSDTVITQMWESGLFSSIPIHLPRGHI